MLKLAIKISSFVSVCWGIGAEGFFLVILVGTIYMRVVVVSSVSVAGRPCADLITDLAVVTL